MSWSRRAQLAWSFMRTHLNRLGVDDATIDRMKRAVVRPLARPLAYLPGGRGMYFDQIVYDCDHGARAEKALRDFEHELLALTADSICVDLGANVGVFTEKLAVHAGMVHAFEPDPTAFALLYERVGHLPNVRLHNAAVSTKDGTVMLRRLPEVETRPGLTAASSIVNRSLSQERGPDVEVANVDFIRFIRELGQPVAIIKMDIEGAEVEILEALLEAPERELINTLFVETHQRIFPEQAIPIARLRRAFGRLDRPNVNFDWP